MAPKRKPDPAPTDAETLTLAGLALFGTEWPAQMAKALDVSKDVIRDIRRDRLELYPENAERLRTMLDQRAAAMKAAQPALKAWMKKVLA